MRKLSILGIALLSFQITLGQQSDPLKVLQKQVEAFNSKDINSLVRNVTQDFKWYYIGSDSLILEVDGQEKFRTSMESYFNFISEVETVIDDYTVEGNKISFKETVHYQTSAGKEGSASAMAIYEIKDGLIFRVWYFL